MTISIAKTVRLGDLAHDPVIMAMPGQEARLTNIDDLKASIPVHGLLQGLKVRVDAEGIRYLVTAGSRRLAALFWLRSNGGAIRGALVTDELQVPVIHSEESDDDAREQAVAENIQRVPPTPAAEAKAFGEMAKRVSEKEIAAHFGVPVRRVQQRLKLGALHPDVLAALEANEISLQAAQAFTVEPDPKRQKAYFDDARKSGKSWMLGAEQVKRAFTDELVASDGPIAKLLGKKAYEAAGGEVVSDSFGDRAYWVSRDVIEKLLKAHWADQEKAWKAEGWAWVVEAGEYGDSARYGVPYSMERVAYGGHKFTAAERAYSGVLYWRDGSRDTVLGVIDPKKAAPPRRAGDNAEPGQPSADLANPGSPVLIDLTARLTEAVQAKVAMRQDLALPILVATLHAQMRRGGYPPVAIGGVRQGGRLEAEPKQGKDFVEALEWARQQPIAILLTYLAELVAPNVSVKEFAGGSAAEKRALIDYVDPDSLSRFDADDYFASITKPLIALAYREMTGETLKDGKKAEMAAAAAKEAKACGWLPPQLRTPSYAGPKPGGAGKQKSSPAADAGEAHLVAAE